MKKERFTIDAWLQDMSRKVVDEDGDSIDPCVCRLGWLLEIQNRIFIVTPEEEMTEFEKAFLERVFHQKAEELDEENREIFREDARCVLELARDQFIKDGYILEKQSFHDAVEKVTPEVMKEVSDKVDMEEALRLEYERGKAEALKDLPRWKKCGPDTGQIILYKGFCNEQNCLYVGGYKIMLSDLEKLPKDE